MAAQSVQFDKRSVHSLKLKQWRDVIEEVVRHGNIDAETRKLLEIMVREIAEVLK